jgi:hypothetical protein
MDSLRRLCVEETPHTEACSRCGSEEGRWDWIGDNTYCPRCEEALILGEIDALRERPQDGSCAVCNKVGTLRYLTFPLHAHDALEIHLCGEHFGNLLGRRLPPHAFHQLRRLLSTLELNPAEVFLLHEEFYNPSGKALRPIHNFAC